MMLRLYLEGDDVRVAKDRPPYGRGGPCRHLTEEPDGKLRWVDAQQGAIMPRLSRRAFVAWLDQGGK